MKVLVTGGCGYIGSRLIRELPYSTPYVSEVIIYDNLVTERYCSLFNLPQGTGVHYKFYKGDIRDADKLRWLLAGVDTTVHLAGMTHAELSFERSQEYWDVNYHGTQTVAECCAAAGSSLVYVSTAGVYGSGMGDEASTDLHPTSPYAEAKLAGEKSALDVGGTVLRLGTIYGPSPGMRFHTVVNKFVYSAAIGVPLQVWEGAEEQTRPYLDLKDCVNAILFSLLNPFTTGGAVFNVVTENEKLMAVISEIQKHRPDVDIVRTPSLIQASYGADPGRLLSKGFRYEGNMAQGIADTFALFEGFVNPK